MVANSQISEKVSSRRQRNRERTIQEILDTARLIIREKGVAALTMHELASRMGIRPPSLYNYFSGLMEIYDALFRMGFQMWGEHLKKSTRDARTWQEEVRQVMEAYLTFALQNPELYQLCFERPVPGFVPSEESLRISFGILENAYQRVEGLKENLDTGLEPKQIADLIIALTHGLTSLHMANEPQLALGQGRFGSLIPAAVAVLDQAWSEDKD